MWFFFFWFSLQLNLITWIPLRLLPLSKCLSSFSHGFESKNKLKKKKNVSLFLWWNMFSDTDVQMLLSSFFYIKNALAWINCSASLFFIFQSSIPFATLSFVFLNSSMMTSGKKNVTPHSACRPVTKGAI